MGVFGTTMAETFKEGKAKIEAFLTHNLASVLPELCSERLLSKQEELDVSLTGPSRRAHTVTKMLESKITNQPELFGNLMKILQSFKFDEGPGASNDDSDLPHGMTILTDDHETIHDSQHITYPQRSSLLIHAGATRRRTHRVGTSRHQNLCIQHIRFHLKPIRVLVIL